MSPAWRPFHFDMMSTAMLHTKNPAVAGGVCSPTKVGDVLLGDVLCPALQWKHVFWGALHHRKEMTRSRVLPHVSHFMQVPFRTSLELPHSLRISL
jgi:hypothetical protein